MSTINYYDKQTCDVVSDSANQADHPQADGHRHANLDAALRLAAAGLPIFPVRMVENQVGDWDKRPVVKGWRRVATTNPIQIQEWWNEFPQAVPGIQLERAGLVVIDADRHIGGSDGVSALKELISNHGIPECPTTKTAGEGTHLIFAQPDGARFGNSEGSLPDGINVRGAGGFIVGPGAVRPDGARYRCADGTIELAKAFASGTIPILPANRERNHIWD